MITWKNHPFALKFCVNAACTNSCWWNMGLERKDRWSGVGKDIFSDLQTGLWASKRVFVQWGLKQHSTSKMRCIHEDLPSSAIIKQEAVRYSFVVQTKSYSSFLSPMMSQLEGEMSRNPSPTLIYMFVGGVLTSWALLNIIYGVFTCISSFQWYQRLALCHW